MINGFCQFAAVNSGRGFVSFYGDVFGGKEIIKRYLIKGGPGTGKSTFMRNVAKKAADEGLDVEYFHCSSDPSSLDGIIINGSVAVLDATAPHCMDAQLPGACDELVDLGAFWNSEGLEGECDSIKKLSAMKTHYYEKAYRFLEAAMCADEENRRISSKYSDRKGMVREIKRIMSRLPRGEGCRVGVSVCDSVGIGGRVRIGSYEENAKDIYYIEDKYKSGSAFLALVAKAAMQKGMKMRVSYRPLDPSQIDALFLEESKTAFVLFEEHRLYPREKDGKRIKMEKFVHFGRDKQSRDDKSEYKFTERLCAGALLSAEEELKKAGECHFELENIYKKYMDFDEESLFCEALAKKIVKKSKNSVAGG